MYFTIQEFQRLTESKLIVYLYKNLEYRGHLDC